MATVNNDGSQLFEEQTRLKVVCLSLILCFALSAAMVGFAQESLSLKKLLHYMGQKYDGSAQKRVIAWRNIITQHQTSTEIEQLNAVNQFFNLFQFVNDIDHWGQEDYWATPIEFIGTQAGDCEDFSIAKYFSLLELGISVEKLRLTYVKASRLNQFHMVLAYYPDTKSEPLILDNLDGEIKLAHQRTDLIPIFSFNGQKLWLNKQKGQGRLVGSANQLDNWNDLTRRYQINEFMD